MVVYRVYSVCWARGKTVANPPQGMLFRQLEIRARLTRGGEFLKDCMVSGYVFSTSADSTQGFIRSSASLAITQKQNNNEKREGCLPFA